MSELFKQPAVCPLHIVSIDVLDDCRTVSSIEFKELKCIILFGTLLTSSVRGLPSQMTKLERSKPQFASVRGVIIYRSNGISAKDSMFALFLLLEKWMPEVCCNLDVTDCKFYNMQENICCCIVI
eukprot:scaffold1406_cov284-Chaetoceros_neogracile.AAC.4